jgi:hypothetical protein
LTIRNGNSCYHKRHNAGHFEGKLIPFGCLVDYCPTKRTCRKSKSLSSKDPDPGEGDEADEELDDGNEPDNVGEDITAQAELLDKNKSEIVDDIDHGDTDLPKFAPRRIPGIFLGHRMSPGGVWKGDYFVCNLSDLRHGKRNPRIQRVRSILADNSDGWKFPMKSLYDYVQRSGLYRRNKSSDTETDHSDRVFDHDKGDVSSGAEKAEKTAKDVEVSWGDHWDVNEDEGTLTYNNVMLRKRMFVLTKSEDHVDLSKVSNVRTTKGK